jgi:hypothetical protein
VNALYTASKNIDIKTDLKVDRKSVCSYLGYKNDVEPSTRIASLLDEYMVNAGNLIKPSYSYVIRDIESVMGPRIFIQGSGGLISNMIIFESDAIARLLAQCEKVAVFVLTIGSQLEDMVGWLANKGLIIEAYVLDAIGSNFAEKLADSVESKIREVARTQGYCISRRFSPGHCDWDISQQRGVFRAVGDDSVGVQLTDSYLMVPQKSISGIMGIGPCDGDVESHNPCQPCSKRNCLWRR